MGVFALPDSSHIFQAGSDTVGMLDTSAPTGLPVLSELSMNTTQFSQNAAYLVSTGSDNWYFYFLMILIAGYALSRAFLGQLLSSTFLSALSYNNAASMFKDNSQLQRQRDFVLYAFYFLSISFFIMLLEQQYSLLPGNMENVKLLSIVTMIILGYFLFRVLVANLLGLVFNNLSLFRENIYIGYSYNKLVGIILLPLNFALLYSADVLREILIFIGIAVILIMIIMKIARGIQFSFKHNVFNFYLFLYLCALEIVPLLLIYKWLKTITEL